VRTRVVEKGHGTLRLKVMSGGEIADSKGVNIPNKQLLVLTLSKKDKEKIQFAKKCDIEYIAFSFTRSAQDVINVRFETEGFKEAIIAKIENSEGINKFADSRVLRLHDADQMRPRRRNRTRKNPIISKIYNQIMQPTYRVMSYRITISEYKCCKVSNLRFEP
jgi:hypothetical protein